MGDLMYEMWHLHAMKFLSNLKDAKKVDTCSSSDEH